MKKILMTLVMLAPMTVAAEGMIMLEQGENVRGVSRNEVANNTQATRPSGPVSPLQWDEVQKRRMSRAFDAVMRHLVIGGGIAISEVEANNEAMRAAGSNERDVAIADLTMRIAGFEWLLNAATPYRSDLRGYKIETNKFSGRGGEGSPTISILLEQEKNSAEYMDLVGDAALITEDSFDFYQSYVEEWKANLSTVFGTEYDPDSYYAKKAREALEKRVPPRDLFKLN